MRFALLAVLLLACAREPDKPEVISISGHVLPTWLPLPAPKSRTAKPVTWKADGRPTLLLFTASWCPSCPASLLVDLALAQAYSDRFQVGIGLVDNTDEDFVRSPMATLLSDLPVWNAESVRDMASKCGAQKIPLACLVKDGRVLFRGSAGQAKHVLDAYTEGRLPASLVADTEARAAVGARFSQGITEEAIPEIVKATHHDPSWQNSIAYGLVARKTVTAADVGLAVALARDAVASEGGFDYSHLDTYSLALSKANLPDEAAAVGWRVLHVCKTVHSECMIEKRRAWLYIYYARERVK